MKFMLTWSIKTENRHVVFERFSNADLSQEMPEGISRDVALLRPKMKPLSSSGYSYGMIWSM